MKPPDARTVNPGQAVTYTGSMIEDATTDRTMLERYERGLATALGLTYGRQSVAWMLAEVLRIRQAVAERTAAPPRVADEPRTAPIKRATGDPFGDY